MSVLKEFKDFAMKGNVIDLAVGVIIGGAFSKIVDSLVNDMMMPIFGRMLGGLDFSNFFIMLANPPAHVPQTLDALKKAGVPLFAYGVFLNTMVNFLIIAFAIFMVIKQLNKLKNAMSKEDAAVLVAAERAKAAEPAPPTPEDIQLLREIRDALKAGIINNSI